eukprot:g10864.t1
MSCKPLAQDMKRFSILLAGASWMGEYGDPSTSDWDDFLHKYSPYHLVKEDATYPAALFVTSTKDDRVHPGRPGVEDRRARWFDTTAPVDLGSG